MRCNIVLAPGGRLGLSVWDTSRHRQGPGRCSGSRWASSEKVANQAAMVALGRPGVGAELLTRWGYQGIERIEIPFVWEFPDPETYARALASTGPAYEAIQAVGEDAFARSAEEEARARLRAGLPLRAEINVVGYLARKPVEAASSPVGFLSVPETSPEVQSLYDGDLEELGYVMNSSKLWAHQPAVQEGIFDVMGQMVRLGGLTFRQRGILVTACASAMGDSYCSLAWANKLAKEANAALAGSVLAATDVGLDDSERALAGWARQVARDPNGTTGADVQVLRDVGFDDAQIFAITVFVAMRLAFSTVNDALGAVPDQVLVDTVPDEVRAAVTFGRRPARSATAG